jgi:hypothetical protein
MTEHRAEKRPSASPLGKFRRNQDYICPIRFHNPLPQVPSEQRLLAYPFAPDKFIKYQLTSLEAEYQHRLLTTLDMGLQIDLINPEVYIKGKGEGIQPEDEELFENPRKEAPVLREKKRKGTGNYLRKSRLPNFGPMAAHPEPKAKPTPAEDELDLDPSSLIPKILDSFAPQALVHPLKPDLKPAKVYSVLPDMSSIHREFTLLSFDEDPLDHPSSLRVLKEHEDEEGDSILALYASQAGESAGGEQLPYVRNYKYTHSGEPGQKDVVLWLDEEGNQVLYSMVDFKMSLKKKKVPKGIVTPNDANLPKAGLKVTFRPEKKEELLRKRARLEEYDCSIPEDLNKDIEDIDEAEDVEVVGTKQLIAELFGDDEEPQDD